MANSKYIERKDDQELIKVALFCGSAGAINVLERFVKDINQVPKVAIVVVLHRKTSMQDHLVNYLGSMIHMKVEAIEHGVHLEEGAIYVAPAGYHCILEKDMTLSLDLSEKVMFSRPSADVSLESFSYNLKDKLIAIIVSGANADGAEGAKWVNKRNGKVIVQSPVEAFAKAMPGAVIEAVEQVDHIVPAHEIYKTAAKYF